MPPRKSDNDAERLARLNLRLDRLREINGRTPAQKSRTRGSSTRPSSHNRKKRQ